MHEGKPAGSAAGQYDGQALVAAASPGSPTQAYPSSGGALTARRAMKRLLTCQTPAFARNLTIIF